MGSVGRRSGSKRGRHDALGSALPVLRFLYGLDIPDDPLGPDSVPRPVLEIPVAVLTEHLVEHNKRCRNFDCPHIPPPLRIYQRMRPVAVRRAADQIHEVLWNYPDHDLVRLVRETILEIEAPIAEEVSNGTLLKGDRLGQLITEGNQRGAARVAAVVWALEFKAPGTETLFRILIPLFDRPGEAIHPRGKARPQHDGDVRSLRAELRKERKQGRTATRALEEARQVVKAREAALREQKKALQDLQKEHRQAKKDLVSLGRRLEAIEAEHRTVKVALERTTQANQDLRRDLRRLQDSQRELDVERSDLARKLAAARREIEQLELRIASQPTGSDAVWRFLEDEKERIKRDRMILSGGAERRAKEEWTAYRKLERAFLTAYPQYRRPRPVAIKKKIPLGFISLGGAVEVGRSCYLVALGSHRILVDCGIRPGADRDLHPDLERIDRIDALVLTHAHTDHIGWVPALIRRFGDFDIYCSEGTAALLPIMLRDCRQHYARKIAIRREMAQYMRDAAPVVEEYDEEHVEQVTYRLIECGFGEHETLPFGDISLRFFEAGHILGATSVLIEDASERRIFVSGDFSSFPQLTIGPAKWRDDLGEIDLLVLESTYGDRDHDPAPDRAREDLLKFIRTTIESGSVILASFALGRAQEILSLVSRAIEEDQLPGGVPVYVDGLIRRINPIYERLANFRVSGHVYEVGGEMERREVAARAGTTPSIIVTTSGMLAGGPVVEYAKELLPDPRHRIVLTGYQDEGAPSQALRRLVRSGRGSRTVELQGESGEPVRFRAALPAEEVSLSAHADQQGLVDYAARLAPRYIALVHGETKAQTKLRRRLLGVHPSSKIVCGPDELPIP